VHGHKTDRTTTIAPQNRNAKMFRFVGPSCLSNCPGGRQSVQTPTRRSRLQLLQFIRDSMKIVQLDDREELAEPPQVSCRQVLGQQQK
jgi:hypothetical protein